ncbi:MAG: hypothetical protein KJ578_07180 [Bacteroidetes bacterium]|nr:hypothetical protein [Bacteroidota bacterium]MBU1578570.1 hypothetical protein [Bacteroidota bacterium]MBU2466730.1 hypothetical protein [Bacteroidota bacterium]MBU2557544.1 hypothetical protein [Bacteroidota bacterium]
MGKFNQGVHGGFKGRVGNIVGSNWKGTGVMRIRPASVSNPRTDLQQNVRTRFALMGHFLSTQRALVRIGWRAMVSNTTPHNEAMRYNLANAISGEYPDLFIDFSKVKLSVGELYVPTGLQVSSASAKSLNLSWQHEQGTNQGGNDDLLMIGIYDAESAQGFTQLGGATRQQQSVVITLPDNWIGRTVEVFVFMVSSMALTDLNNPAHISQTLYGGSLVLTD